MAKQTKSALKNELRSILSRNTVGSRLTPEEEKVAKEAFAILHLGYKRKMQNFAFFTVGFQMNNKCFIIHKTDGSTDDISMNGVKKPEADISAAIRRAVSIDVVSFKNSSPLICHSCQRQFHSDMIDVHHDQMIFDTIVKEIIQIMGKERLYQDIDMDTPVEHSSGFMSSEIIEQVRQYHSQYAHLVLLCNNCHKVETAKNV